MQLVDSIRQLHGLEEQVVGFLDCNHLKSLVSLVMVRRHGMEQVTLLFVACGKEREMHLGLER